VKSVVVTWSFLWALLSVSLAAARRFSFSHAVRPVESAARSTRGRSCAAALTTVPLISSMIGFRLGLVVTRHTVSSGAIPTRNGAMISKKTYEHPVTCFITAKATSFRSGWGSSSPSSACPPPGLSKSNHTMETTSRRGRGFHVLK